MRVRPGTRLGRYEVVSHLATVEWAKCIDTSTGARALDFGLAKVRSGVVKGAAAFRDTVPLDVSQPGTLILRRRGS